MGKMLFPSSVFRQAGRNTGKTRPFVAQRAKTICILYNNQVLSFDAPLGLDTDCPFVPELPPGFVDSMTAGYPQPGRHPPNLRSSSRLVNAQVSRLWCMALSTNSKTNLLPRNFPLAGFHTPFQENGV
ncbi:hypothetical protein WGC32_00590 [Zongyangia sp. HA2173]|uniref:hypothetical protein n=1 Tax=Zongyangia sp. HA2173 TaxID=3133035 RepID=UPI00316246BD